MRACRPLRAARVVWPARLACVGGAGHRPQRAGRPRGRVTRAASGTVSRGPLSGSRREARESQGAGAARDGLQLAGPCSPDTLGMVGPARTPPGGRWGVLVRPYVSGVDDAERPES